jgi:mevalonate kinase
MNSAHKYPAKLLLFGEYTVHNGSRALAVPLSLWTGSMQYRVSSPDTILLNLCAYLMDRKVFSPENCDAFKDEIRRGIYFASDIPQGYGVGSSGALCAAIYDRFFTEEGPHSDLVKIRHDLAAMENFFHGTSSGMDPLVSLMNAPVLREMDRYHILPRLKWPEHLQPFLIDSGVTRTTGGLVKEYMSWSAQDHFRMQCLRPLIQSVDHAISFLLDGGTPMLWEHLKLISLLEFKYFSTMIPASIAEIWESSLDHPHIALKLCGAGGGGFFLGFAYPATAMNDLSAYKEIILIPEFM